MVSGQRKHGVPLKVKDVMVREVMVIDENVTVKDAAERMNKFELGCLIVVREEKAVGILTERDILKRVVTETKDPRKTKVKDAMSSPLVVAKPNMDLEVAIKLMFQMRIKKLPVVVGKRLVGLVTLTDIARFQPALIQMLNQLVTQQTTPKRMQKVIDYYVV